MKVGANKGTIYLISENRKDAFKLGEIYAKNNGIAILKRTENEIELYVKCDVLINILSK